MSGSVRGSPVCGPAGGDGVVDVVGRLLPGVEDDLLVGVVRVQRGDDALDRVVEQHRADAGVGHLALGLVQVRGAEERLVLPDRLALVVEHRAARADPAVRRGGLHQLALRVADSSPGLRSAASAGVSAPQRIARFGLDLLLDLAPEAVGIGEADLDPDRRRAGSCEVRLARQRSGERRLAGAPVALQVVDDAGRRFTQQRRGLRLRVCDEGLQPGAAAGRRRSPRARSPRFSPSLPITAVATTIPSASKAAAVRLRLGSVTSRGCRTR